MFLFLFLGEFLGNVDGGFPIKMDILKILIEVSY